MRQLYVDTSAIIPTMSSEVYTEWAKDVLDGRGLVSSVLTEVELTRYTYRAGMDPKSADEVSESLLTLAIDSRVLQAAKLIIGKVKTLDAIHLGTWVQARAFGLDCDFVTADRRLAAAAQGIGARVIHPFEDL
ncbi:type II toxin-antitoxin system VapC family toxin [Corynebacterium sp. HMSC074A01]|uniref:type II toxin-antitoxin system VapC family toxin n=1 Tax=Corynebacterium sp. HMSC074A01 TaxID=1715030 RepID=UPI0008A449DE|nr:type II toxin-antitoxin system VapC family toxin [Corynebacterium sp. HMSC074A01]OHF36720.1 hypothetical protein HMPREF2550_05650 [Corynebacterium sp. HMSC074A01]